jgi:hypothetical protein
MYRSRRWGGMELADGREWRTKDRSTVAYDLRIEEIGLQSHCRVLRQAQDEEIWDCITADGIEKLLMLSLSKHPYR